MPINSAVGPKRKLSRTLATIGASECEVRHDVAHALAGVLRIDDRDHLVARVRDHAVRGFRCARGERARREHDVAARCVSRGRRFRDDAEARSRRAARSCRARSVMPSNGSRATRNGPSRSAQSTSGESCAAAVERIALSTMQPSMIFKPSARAVWIIASAPRIPPHFTSLTLIPSTQPAQRGQIAGVLGILVGHDRDRRALANPAQPLRRSGRDRLFAELDLEAFQLAQDRHRRFGRPGLVGIDADRAGVDRANRRDGLDLGAARRA